MSYDSFAGNDSISTRSEEANEALQSRSDMAQELLSHKPDFIERWALLLFAGILAALLAATWFIKYPDTIEAKATLTTNGAPKEIFPHHEGRLIRLFVHNDDKVRTHQVLGWIESTGSHEEILQLSAQLDSTSYFLSVEQPKRIAPLFAKRFDHLGELQTAYQNYITVWQQFNDYLLNGFYRHKKELLKQDMNTLSQMGTAIEQQKEIAEKDENIAQESFKMNDILLQEKIISKEEYRNEQSKLLSKQNSLPQIHTNALSNLTQQHEKQKEIDQLEHDVSQQKLIFEEEMKTLKSAVDEWLLKYTITAPIDGKVVFIIPLQENNYLGENKLLGYILTDSTQYYTEVILSQSNFGKVKINQPVQLRFDAYPYEEFGFVRGRITYISNIPSDSGFLATVQLDNGLLTSYDKTLQYKSKLTAQALIITRNMRLLQRFYYNITKNMSVNKKI